MIVKVRTVIITCIILIACCMYFLLGNENSILFSVLFLVISVVVVVDSTMQAVKNQCLLSFITIANVFAVAIFVLRPLQLLMSNDFSESAELQRYFTYYGEIARENLPWAKASLIGMLGIFCVNFPFLSSKYKSSFSIRNMTTFIDGYKFTWNQHIGLGLFVLLGLFSAGVYILKKSLYSSVHIYDMLWIFIFSCIIIYLITRKRTAGILVYLLIGLSIIVLSLGGRRQYIVNLLLCYIIPLYYAGKNRKTTFIRIGFMLLGILVVVFVYAGIRRSLIGDSTEVAFVEGILDEFCMYDMLLASLCYVKTYGINFFMGYNYLTVFTTPIQGLSIEQFDHRLTDMVFQGKFYGAVPTSLFGSLYFNFSFIGVCIGAILVGTLLLYIQKRLSTISTYESIGYYSIVSTFVYDLIRVGDFGRELWSLITLLLVYYVFSFFMNKFGNDNLRLKGERGYKNGARNKWEKNC